MTTYFINDLKYITYHEVHIELEERRQQAVKGQCRVLYNQGWDTSPFEPGLCLDI